MIKKTHVYNVQQKKKKNFKILLKRGFFIFYFLETLIDEYK